MSRYALLLIFLLPFTLTACIQQAGVRYGDEPQYTKKGPPPHAPAHGYRHKHKNHDMVFDTGIGAYVVIGMAEHYFLDNSYFRYRDGRWQIGMNLDGDDWRDARDYEVPSGLLRDKASPHPGKGKKDKGNKNKWDD